LFRYNRYFNRNATAQRIAISAFVRAIRLHPKYDTTPQPLFCCNALRMYVSALHHLGSLYSEMNNAEMAYKVLQKAAAMRPDRKDISCNLFMAQRRYGIWNVRAMTVDCGCVCVCVCADCCGLLFHRIISHHFPQAYDDMVERVLDLWKQRVLIPAGEGKQKSFVRPLEPDASYDSHETGEVRPPLLRAQIAFNTRRMCFVRILSSLSALQALLQSLPPKVSSSISTPRPPYSPEPLLLLHFFSR
jgi:tetratricopeptide (TPR) repeat protein